MINIIKPFCRKLSTVLILTAMIGSVAGNQSVYAESKAIDNISAAAESGTGSPDGEPPIAQRNNEADKEKGSADNEDSPNAPLKPADDMTSIIEQLREDTFEEAALDVWSEFNVPRITLETADWAYIDGDKQRGWFIDRNTLRRTDKSKLEYWQLIVYNSAGRKLFEDELLDLGYTLQYRQLDTKEHTVKTYAVAAYDIEGKLIEEATDANANKQAIKPNTVGETVAKAVTKLARKLKK